MGYFIDTNIFLRVLIKEDEKPFNECYLLLEAVKTNRIKAATASVVLAEIVWTLSSYYRFSRPRVSRAARSVLNLRGLKIFDAYNHRLALNLYEGKKVKYIDALLASLEKIQSRDWVVVSYDKDFDKLGVVRREPGEILLDLE